MRYCEKSHCKSFYKFFFFILRQKRASTQNWTEQAKARSPKNNDYKDNFNNIYISVHMILFLFIISIIIIVIISSVVCSFKVPLQKSKYTSSLFYYV